jgi:hypothetical protein
MTRWLTALLILASVASAGEEEAQRIEQLERKNRELEERLARLESRDDEETQLQETVEEYVDEGLGLNLVIRRGSVQGIVQLFGSVGVRYDNPEVPGRSNTFFFNGNMDLFFTARAGDHFHVLSETVFLTSLGEPKDDGHFDQERLWGAWRFSDLLQIKLGLEHGPISRWNNQFHHGRWLEMTINRPFLARFEGGSGVLPMHNAGVEFTGALHPDVGRIEYFLIVSNGRGRIPTDTHEFSDRNDSKAFELGFGFRPRSIDGLWIGVFGRYDEMPPNPSDPARLQSIRQLIGSFQVDYRGDPLEVLFEFAYVDDDDHQSGMSFGHILTYVQVAYRVNDRWVVYSRFDVREMDQGDPYYMPYDRDLDIWEVLAGVRFDFIANASIKFEVGGGEAEKRDGGGGVATDGYIRFGFQLAWVF